MRPSLLRVFAASCGILVALLLVLISFYLPITVVPSGTVELIPAVQNNTPVLGLAACQETNDCLVAGWVQLNFTVPEQSRLSGTLESPRPIELFLAEGSQIEITRCQFGSPPSNCTAVPGGYAFEVQGSGDGFDLSALKPYFAGPGNTLPAGDWSLYLVNWSPGPQTVTVTSAITLAPLY